MGIALLGRGCETGVVTITDIRCTGSELVVLECYGLSKAKKSRNAGKKIVDRLRKDHRVKRSTLMDVIGVEDTKTFQRRIKPLMNHSEGNLRVAVTSEREGRETYYRLDRTYYDTWDNRIVQNVRNAIDTKPRREVEKLEEENRELREEVRELRERLKESDPVESSFREDLG